MKLNLYGNLKEFKKGIDILKNEIGLEVAEDGIPVKVKTTQGNINVKLENGRGEIKCAKRIEFFRALGLFIENAERKNTFEITEESQFEMNGPMIDVSRNAVLKVKSIKKFLRLMAVMGLNMLMLYTEDTYEVSDYPYFGYMRGRYSYDELKEIDNYADILGIEVIPCIQTLAHLEKFLRWRASEQFKDTSSVLLVGEPKVYELIENLIQTATAPFKTKRIHIGMDEAWGLGLGAYLKKNGYRVKNDIMNEHVAKVVQIVERLGLKPMMWSDMYFRIGSKTGSYYDLDTNITDEVVEAVPKNMQLVYWDYCTEDKGFYKDFINLHKKFKRDVIFAGGVWCWNGMVVNYRKAFNATNAALAACKEEGVREVIATMWGDDGAETNYFSAILGLQLYAEHGYSRELDNEKLKKRFEFCTGADFDAFRSISLIDEIPGTENEHTRLPSNPSKYLLYQDILVGLFDKYIQDINLGKYYTELEKDLTEYMKQNPSWSFVFDISVKLCSVLSIKSNIGIRLKEMYEINDLEGLKMITEKELPELYEKVDELRKSHRRQWMRTNKAFGWEIIDIRYGGVLARIDSAITRIENFIEGKIEKLEELEQERLYFDGPERPEGTIVGRGKYYTSIVSACPL